MKSNTSKNNFSWLMLDLAEDADLVFSEKFQVDLEVPEMMYEHGVSFILKSENYPCYLAISINKTYVELAFFRTEYEDDIEDYFISCSTKFQIIDQKALNVLELLIEPY